MRKRVKTMVLTVREASRMVEDALAAARQTHSKIGITVVLCREQKIVADLKPAGAVSNEMVFVSLSSN